MLPLFDLSLPILGTDPISHVQDHTYGGILGQLGITKHVLMMWLSGGLCCVIFIWMANRYKQTRNLPRGPWMNFLEATLFFIRDDILRASMGDEGAKYAPILWTTFFFILFCNLLGLVPGMATATGNLSVTGPLAVMAFLFYNFAGIWKEAHGHHGEGFNLARGFVKYFTNMVPSGLPKVMVPLILLLEVIGHLSKGIALALRLFANMVGGHVAVAVLFGFVAIFELALSYFAIGGVVLFANTFLYLLEILVAFIQAFVFTFLVGVFLSLATAGEH